MKFTGLILICAASCLALILPAIGVVKFPVVDQNYSQLTEFQSNVNQGNALLNGFTTTEASNSSQSSLGPNGTLPVRTMTDLISNSGQTTPNNPTSSGATNSQEFSIASQRLGMSIWLLLGPTALVGLIMWTIFPAPRSNSSAKAG